MPESAHCNECAMRLGFHATFSTNAWQDTEWQSLDLRYSLQCPPSKACGHERAYGNSLDKIQNMPIFEFGLPVGAR